MKFLSLGFLFFLVSLQLSTIIAHGEGKKGDLSHMYENLGAGVYHKDQVIQKVLHRVQDYLSTDYYQESCPQLEQIVHQKVSAWAKEDSTIAPSLIRLHFHDFAVRGCDASILLDHPGSERTSPVSKSLRGFDLIDDIKQEVEKKCPKTVSCTDILTAAARDATVQIGGPYWDVEYGRKDGKISLQSEVDSVPMGHESITNLIEFFQARGLNLLDLVVLSGAHTKGRSTCEAIQYRIYNFNGTATSDPTTCIKFSISVHKSEVNSPGAVSPPPMEEGMTIVCPWIFLRQDGDEIPAEKQPVIEAAGQAQKQIKKLSYADIAKDRLERTVNIATLPVPTMRGETPVIRIPGKYVHKGLDYLKYAIVTRIEANGRRIEDLKAGIADRWADMSAKISPLGKGYFLARFETEVDYNKVKFGGPWFYGKQVLRVSDWIPNFNVERQTHSNAMIWVKFPGLSMEYWELDILMAMGRTVGTPVHVDRNTLKRDNGFYASVLVDVDLGKPIPEKILVEVEDSQLQFWQEIQLGPIPNFCNVCKVVGHQAADCRLLAVAPQKEGSSSKEITKDNAPLQSVKVNVVSRRKQKRDRKKEKENANRDGIDVEEDSGSENEDGVMEKQPEDQENEGGQSLHIISSMSTYGEKKGEISENIEIVDGEKGEAQETDEIEHDQMETVDLAKDADAIMVELSLKKQTPQETHVGTIVIEDSVIEGNVDGNDELLIEVEATELDPHHEAPTPRVQEDPPGDAWDQLLDHPLGLDSPTDSIVSAHDDMVVPESQFELVKEANMIMQLLEEKSKKCKQGNEMKDRRLVAKISKKNVGLLPPGPLKERLKAACTSGGDN